MTVAEKGVVYLVGAGPGDPELLTVKALRLLESADVVFHDDLVPEEVLALARRHALVTSVGKRCGRPRITQAGIHALMVESSRAGQSVVRLKSGDPLVFGRAGEEIAALRAAGVRFEVVPGVTAAFAAGAALGLPLTDRKSASKLIFVTGHHADGKDAAADLEWGAAGGCDAGGVYAGERFGEAGSGAAGGGRGGGCGLLRDLACGYESAELGGGARGWDGDDGVWAGAGVAAGGEGDGGVAGWGGGWGGA